MKTNAARILDRLKIPYTILHYEVDPDDLAAERTAQKLGLPASQVFKTLVVRGQSHIYLAVIPSNTQLDLKAFAQEVGERKIETVPLKEIQFLTGYIRGGVTALGCKKAYPVYLDRSALKFDQIVISAGKRGVMLQLSAQDYLKAVSGYLAIVSKQ